MSRITVGIRVKPESPEKTLKNLNFKDGKIDISVNGGRHEFQFDHIFDMDSTQENVFSAHSHLVNEVLDGFNGSIFAYGQTGAGKTHTMTGPTNDNFLERGLCMRTAACLFERSRKINSTEKNSISMRLSALEIYNETLTDLLRDSSTSTSSSTSANQSHGIAHSQKLSIVDTPNGIIIPGLYLLPLSNEEDAYNLLFEAYSNRVVAEHQLNRRSSRSHVIYTYYITRTRQSGTDGVGVDMDPEVVNSKLHLIDLAGSERVEKTGSVGNLQKEASHINRSLTFLEQVVVALTQSKRDHIPYRQSKLTYMLKDSLGGNCHTYMVACIWPHESHGWETLSTLRFAARMKSIENTPIRNGLVSKEPASAKLLQQVEQLKRELYLRDSVCGAEAWLPELTKSQRVHTIKTACDIAIASGNGVSDTPTAHPLSPPSPVTNGKISVSTSRAIQLTETHRDATLDILDVTVNSLSQVRLLVGSLRAVLWEACGQDQKKVEDACQRVLAAYDIVDNSTAGRYGGSRSTSPLADENNGEGRKTKNAHKNEKKGVSETGVKYQHDIVNNDTGKEDEKPLPLNLGGQGPHSPTLLGGPGETFGSTPIVSFEDFSDSAQGYPLKVIYENSKNVLQQNKERQRQIAMMLNKLKRYIDDIQQDIENLKKDETGLVDDEIINKLASTKRDYRSAAKELELCKLQVAETQLLKKRALSALLVAFESSTS